MVITAKNKLYSNHQFDCSENLIFQVPLPNPFEMIAGGWGQAGGGGGGIFDNEPTDGQDFSWSLSWIGTDMTEL